MTKYMIIAKVGNKEYMTSLLAESALSAEHYILDQGINGRHDYGVEACMAYDVDMCKTEAFRGAMFDANPVSLEDLYKIIDERNEEIKKYDAAEDEMNELMKKMRELESQMNETKVRFAEVRKIVVGF